MQHVNYTQPISGALRWHSLFILTFLALAVIVQSDFARTTGFDEPIYLSSSNWPARLAFFDGHPPLGKWLFSFASHEVESRLLTHRVIALITGCGLVALLITLVARTSGNLFGLGATYAGFIAGQYLWLYSNLVSLEIFTAFFAVAVVVILAGQHSERSLIRDVSAGICIGAAISVKWSSASLLLVAICSVLFVSQSSSAASKVLSAVRISVTAILTYSVLFVSLSNTPWPEFFQAHITLYRFLQDTTGTFDFQSPMWMWPLGERPIVILGSSERLIILRGCVWLNLFGLIAVADCLRRWRAQDATSQLLTVAFLGTWIPWILVPRDTKFIYYFFVCSIFLTILAARWVSERKRWVKAIFIFGLILNSVWLVLEYQRAV
jgi:hypothetical protein